MRAQTLLTALLLFDSSKAIDSPPNIIQYDVTHEIDNIFYVDLRTEAGGGCKTYKERIVLGYDQAISAIDSAHKAVNQLTKARPGTNEMEAFDEWMRIAQAVQDMFGFDVPLTGAKNDGGKDPEKNGAENLERIQSESFNSTEWRHGADGGCRSI